MALDRISSMLRAWRPWLLAFGLWLALAATAALALWHLRREAQHSGERELSVLSLALADEIERGLRGAEEGLRALRAELDAGRLDLDDPDAALVLRMRADLMPMAQSLWVVDAQGHVLGNSGTAPPPAAGLFQPPLQALGGDGVALSMPFTDDGQASVALALRRPGAGGWILAAVPADALLGAFAVAVPAADAGMAVFSADGTRLAATRAAPAHLDEVPSPPPSPAQRPAVVPYPAPGGGTALLVLQTVPRYALRVAITRDLGAVLQPWRQSAQVGAAVLAVLLVVVAAAVRGVQAAERRRGEAQAALRAQAERSSRLEALGTLAGGVAHDFNNVLAGIVGYGEMAAEEAAAGSAQARHLDRMMQAALRGKALAERILAFGRGGARVSRVFALEPVVEEVLALLSASLRPGTVIERALDAGGARLRGDPTQAFAAVMNLCTNALQAMPRGGMLGVHLRREHAAAQRVLSHGVLPAGDHLVLAVSDQGEGITPEVMEHLFEPFFTTRAAQSGTGLGLAVVHGTVAELGGAIDVRSAPGVGACFTLYLPECAQSLEVPAAGARPQPAGAPALLVVDDEPALAELAGEMLRSLGYVPLCLHDPAAALAALRAEPERFAGLVTDEAMPGMTGMQLAQAARDLQPGLRVLLVSGYGGAALAQRAAQAGVAQVLAKPLRRGELAQALAALLAV